MTKELVTIVCLGIGLLSFFLGSYLSWRDYKNPDARASSKNGASSSDSGGFDSSIDCGSDSGSCGGDGGGD